MPLSEERRQELEGVMWGEVSPINTETSIEYEVSGDVLIVDFIRREIVISTSDDGVGYKGYSFRAEQEEEIRRCISLSRPVDLTAWTFVTGALDDGLWVRSFSQDPDAV